MSTASPRPSKKPRSKTFWIVLTGLVLLTHTVPAKGDRRRERADQGLAGEDPIAFEGAGDFLPSGVSTLDLESATALLHQLERDGAMGCFPEQTRPNPCADDLAKLEGFSPIQLLPPTLAKLAQRSAERIRSVLRNTTTQARDLLREADSVYRLRLLDQAVDGYARLLRLWPGHLDARNNIALAEMHRGHNVAALFHLLVLSALAPNYAGAGLNRTAALARLGFWEDARSAAQSTATQNAQFPAAQYNKGWFENADGAYLAAARSLQAALHVLPNYTKAKRLAALNGLETGASVPSGYAEALPAEERAKLPYDHVPTARTVAATGAHAGVQIVEVIPPETEFVISERQGDWIGLYRIVGGRKHRLWVAADACSFEPSAARSVPSPPMFSAEPAREESDLGEFDPTARNHDGLYLRLSVGAGYTFDSLSGMDANATDMSGVGIRGVCATYDLAVGWTLGRIVVGGLTSGAFLSSPTYSNGRNYARSNYDHAYIFVGPFVDYYLDPHLGTHFGAAIGLGMPSLSPPSNQTGADQGNQDNSPGFGAMLMAGHDFWVSSQWSLGAVARVLYIHGSDEYSATHSAVNLSVLFSALYN